MSDSLQNLRIFYNLGDIGRLRSLPGRKLVSAQNLLAESYYGMGKDYYGRAVELLKLVVWVEEKKLPPNNLDWPESEEGPKDVTRLIQSNMDAGV